MADNEKERKREVRMKKTLKVCMCGLMAAMLVAGCSKKEAEETTAATEAAGTGGTVTLGNYKGVEFTPVVAEVTDEQIEAELQAMLAANPVVTEVEREAKDGDTVNIDYVGMKDGVAFEGGTAQDFDLVLGSGSFIDGFEDGLIGVVKGQEISLNLSFPADYQSPDLAGQAVVFDVTVNGVKEVIPAELNDEFIKANSEDETVDAFKASTKAALMEIAEASVLNQKKSEVFLKVIESSQITVADADVEEYYNEQMARYEEQAAMFGIDLATMLSSSGMTMETFQQQMRDMSKQAIEQEAVVGAIAAAEKMTVAEEDRDALALEFGYESKDAMVEDAGADVVDNYILTEKVVTFIADNAVEAK